MEGRRCSATCPRVVVLVVAMLRGCVRGWSVCVIYVVFDDSLVENGQQTSYRPCGVGVVGRVGPEEVCNAAC